MTGIDVLVQVRPTGDEETDELLDVTDGLREELLTLDVDAVRPVEARDAPDGAKGLAAIAGWCDHLLLARTLTPANHPVEVPSASDAR